MNLCRFIIVYYCLLLLFIIVYYCLLLFIIIVYYCKIIIVYYCLLLLFIIVYYYCLLLFFIVYYYCLSLFIIVYYYCLLLFFIVYYYCLLLFFLCIVVIHLGDSVWSFWVTKNQYRFIVVCIIIVGDPKFIFIFRESHWIGLTQPHLCASVPIHDIDFQRHNSWYFMFHCLS